MRKNYEEPELTLHQYPQSPANVVMTSDPSNNGNNDLFDDDVYDNIFK